MPLDLGSAKALTNKSIQRIVLKGSMAKKKKKKKKRMTSDGWTY